MTRFYFGITGETSCCAKARAVEQTLGLPLRRTSSHRSELPRKLLRQCLKICAGIPRKATKIKDICPESELRSRPAE